MRVIARTPRCAVPTLAHGALPRDTEALRVLARHNRVAPLAGLDPEPCAGVYAEAAAPRPDPRRRRRPCQGGVSGSRAVAAARRIVPAPPIAARRHGATPSISVSSEKLRNVLITTISPST